MSPRRDSRVSDDGVEVVDYECDMSRPDQILRRIWLAPGCVGRNTLRWPTRSGETGGDRRTGTDLHGRAVGGSGAARASRRADRIAGQTLPRQGTERAGEGRVALSAVPDYSLSAAPDYFEPIVGWRVWLVVKDDERCRLRSVLYDALWSPRRELVARCFHRALPLPWRRRSTHLPPAGDCRCGIYATRGPEEAATYLEGRSWADALSVHRVIGTVSLWGRIVECARGWRASRAYPKRIYVPATRAPYWLKAPQVDEVALALTDYGVPVDLLDPTSSCPDDIVAAISAGAARD
jgi:hypothetical protein